jgi:2'-5' RNA ligase
MTTPSIRRQATLFLPEPEAATINALRAWVNPAQAALIAAHVTLCREDEVQDWGKLRERLATAAPIDLTLSFAEPHREGNLVVLPAEVAGNAFARLRHQLLSRPGHEPRPMVPHLTLIHPRNGTCTDRLFSELRQRCSPFTVTIRAVSLIEQSEGAAWREVLSVP